ncbi:IS110 family transposase [Halomonas alkalisoli]|uniref:IS110 family transposase n=1 Tax=Halomonas alkalisoli TaxID=2907158 RepID=UPI001F23AC06|nr:IS110 family transposase [Halomonas alkalisoli]MCE9682369.1 IS110 family transposase [Halomonas alkalisoli]MCE9682788.1 IS110 family transposase [Halomonas alkalisoli]MCE9682845.1 IS110 family transposase [Halomonas alkalisoli]
MKQSNATQQAVVEHTVAERLSTASDVHAAYIGLDVHKASIAVSIAEAGRQDPEFRGEIPNEPQAIDKLVRQLSQRFDGQPLLFSYEAGPCGYGLYHQIQASGHDCEVVAPTLIPRKAGDRIKTDRRDAQMLARLSRSGELTPVWVPTPEQEAIRDLTRAREDMKAIELKARQRLSAFLLRHGKVYRGKSKWVPSHFRWLETVRFDTPVQQIVLEEYVGAVKEAQRRVAGLEKQMAVALPAWSLAPVAEALMAMRGISLITAMTVLAELGDISRFDSPRQLMAYLGLVPSEHSTGASRRQGGITKTGNGHVRRVLVEAAWSYRFPARKTRIIQQRAERTSPTVQAIAWEAQKRLCGRYRRLAATGKVKPLVITAVARELAGFLWAIACEAMGKPHGSRATA